MGFLAPLTTAVAPTAVGAGAALNTWAPLAAAGPMLGSAAPALGAAAAAPAASGMLAGLDAATLAQLAPMAMGMLGGQQPPQAPPGFAAPHRVPMTPGSVSAAMAGRVPMYRRY